jgi:hypothetical protein
MFIGALLCQVMLLNTESLLSENSMAIKYENKGKWQVGDVLKTLFYDQGDEVWEVTYYEITERTYGTVYDQQGSYKLKKIYGDGNMIAMNVKYFDQGVMSCYGNTKDGTLDPTLRVLFGKE